MNPQKLKHAAEVMQKAQNLGFNLAEKIFR